MKNDILWIYKIFWIGFLKKHLPSASLKNTSSVFLNFQKCFSKYCQTLRIYLAVIIVSVFGFYNIWMMKIFKCYKAHKHFLELLPNTLLEPVW